MARDQLGDVLVERVQAAGQRTPAASRITPHSISRPMPAPFPVSITP